MSNVPVKLSAKEAVFTPEMVARAKALGISLDEFAPNAETGGTKTIKAADGWNGAAYWKKDPAKVAENKEKMKSFGKSLYSKTGELAADGSLADAFNIGASVSNWTKATHVKAPRVAQEFVAPPRLMNPRIDTSAQEQGIALSTANAWDRSKLNGTSGMATMSAIHANELEARGKVAETAINQGVQIENQNNQLENKFAQDRATSIYNRSMKQMEVNAAVQDKRDAAIGNAQKNISDVLNANRNYNHDLAMMDKSRLALSAPNQVASLVKSYPGKFDKISDQQLMEDIVKFGSDRHPMFRKKYNLDV